MIVYLVEAGFGSIKGVEVNEGIKKSSKDRQSVPHLKVA
jgi:hypothetical protein